VIEVKTETYFTEGTAGEKILGVPFKYRKIPMLYSKPLQILCIGGAEKASREQYGNLPGPIVSSDDTVWFDFYKSQQIEFIGATDLLTSFLQSE
jgi:hypothetical protein